MSANFFDLQKFAHTGIASSDMSAYDKARALAAFGGGKMQTLTDVPPLSFRANGDPLISWSMSGNGQQTGTPTPDAPIMPTFCGTLSGVDWTIPLTCAGQTQTVYLGQTQTVRRIKKLVFTGEEQIGNYYATYSRFSIVFSDSLILGVRKSPVISSHLIGISDGRGIADVPNNAIYSDSDSGNGRWFIKTTDYTTAADFKAYLADEYAAGTPVTVWYVLATPETGIVNEPLCKIGDYADELSSTVATLPEIPTTTGQNTLTVDTTLQPSEMTITFKG